MICYILGKGRQPIYCVIGITYPIHALDKNGTGLLMSKFVYEYNRWWSGAREIISEYILLFTQCQLTHCYTRISALSFNYKIKKYS
jgi:hypothetical protein